MNLHLHYLVNEFQHPLGILAPPKNLININLHFCKQAWVRKILVCFLTLVFSIGISMWTHAHTFLAQVHLGNLFLHVQTAILNKSTQNVTPVLLVSLFVWYNNNNSLWGFGRMFILLTKSKLQKPVQFHKVYLSARSSNRELGACSHPAQPVPKPVVLWSQVYFHKAIRPR